MSNSDDEIQRLKDQNHVLRSENALLRAASSAILDIPHDYWAADQLEELALLRYDVLRAQDKAQEAINFKHPLDRSE